jgi:hypothetical protein
MQVDIWTIGLERLLSPAHSQTTPPLTVDRFVNSFSSRIKTKTDFMHPEPEFHASSSS